VTAAPRPKRRTAALVAILAAAFNLRIGIVAIGPIIEEIRADTGMSSAVAGILTTIPFFCMGIFAFFGPPLVRRLGEARVILISLGLIILGTLVRSSVPSAVLVLLMTLPIGLGLALIGVTLPAVVKVIFPDRGGAVTGAYVASLSSGIVLVGLGLIPLADALGGWRPALALTAIPAAAAALLWVLTGGMGRDAGSKGTDGDEVPVRGLPGSSGLGWKTPLLLALTFGLQSMCFAGMVSWAPTIYEDAGWTQSQAALVTSSIGGFTVIASLTVPAWSEGRDRRPWITITAVVMALGVLGVGIAPTTLAPISLPMFGLGTGAVFALLLTVPLDMADDHHRVAELSAWMLGIGYMFSGLAPVLTGALRDLTGSFTTPMVLLAVLGIASGALVRVVPQHVPAAASDP
jgi:MFS transporter, CP family, cyanate transporter